jgi:transcriptional regulator with XRE-family HTH domain
MDMGFNERMIAERIAFFRKQQHMSQEKLAEHMDVSIMTVRRLETNRQKISLARATEIANILGCTVNDMVDGFLENEITSPYNRFSTILSGCSGKERAFLFDALQAMLNVYRRTISAEKSTGGL